MQEHQYRHNPDKRYLLFHKYFQGLSICRLNLLLQHGFQYDSSMMANDSTPYRCRRGDVIELHPAYEETAYRIELFGDEIDKLAMINPLTGQTLETLNQLYVYPAVHYVMPQERIEAAVGNIRAELEERLDY